MPPRQKSKMPAKAFDSLFVFKDFLLCTFVATHLLFLSCDSRSGRIGRGMTLSELRQLAAATNAFELHFGHPIPSDSIASVRNHLATLKPHGDFTVGDEKLLAQLDNAERLVFWLGGPTTSIGIDLERPVFYEFSSTRLADRDQDGFPELTNWNDALYTLDRNNKLINCEFNGELLSVPTDPALYNNVLQTSKK